MPRRSTPQAKTDDLAFPVRVKFAVPGRGISSIHDTLGQRMRDWLQRELPPGDHAWHAALSLGTNATAIYFRRVSDTLRFVEAFPEFALADATQMTSYTRPGGSMRASSVPPTKFVIPAEAGTQREIGAREALDCQCLKEPTGSPLSRG
jgi:hypothetical protein